MSHNNFKYHILKSTVPSFLLQEYGYPINCNESQSETWIGFDGKKSTDLESAFDDYLVIDPPSYMPITKNMTQEQFKAIVRTRGSTEADGWLGLLV